MKRLISCLLAIVMVLALVPVSAQAAEVTASGTCGENLTWTLDSAGTLTISGTGSMEFVNNNCPWYDYKYNINTVVLENGVTSIEDDAFYGCENMTRVTIPDSVTSIGQSAFRECYSLREVSISRYVTYIGNYAFQFCTRMTGIYVASGNPNYSSEAGALYNKNKTELLRVPGGFYGTLVVPNTVTTIAPSAFQSCDGLYGVELPDSVTSIGLSAFLFCKNLKKITIPASVTSIGDYAFDSCQKLTEITFKGDAPSIAREAFLNATATAYYPAGNATWTEEVRQNYGGTITWEPYVVTVADGTCGENLTWTLDTEGTLTISGTGPMTDYAAEAPWYGYRESVKSIVIGAGVTSIGTYAFRDCCSLTSVTIPNSVTSIGHDAFARCSSLTSVTIPDGVTSIGHDAFAHCSSLTSVTIPDGVTSIGSWAFRDCSSLTSITIPESVTSIDNYAFYCCSSLDGIWVDQNNTYYSSDDRGVLFNKDKTTLIAAPGEISGAYVIPQSVTSIGSRAFRDCSSLTGITIPDGVSRIGESTFSGCSSLTSITIPESVTSIGDRAFSVCSSLTSVTIPDGVTSIGSFVFSGCSSLTSVTIPDGVTTISDLAFNGCSSLTGITIPESVTSIGQSAFVGCSSLTSITIPDGVTRIDSDAFWECSSLDGIWVDQNNAYYSSDDRGVLFNKDKTALLIAPGGISGEYTVPESVTSIGGCAFCYCSGLTGVTFEGDAPSIGSYAFEGTTTTAYYPAGKTTWTDAVKQSYGGSITWASYVPPVASGTCGENLTWKLDSEGTLTISGTGAMKDYASQYDLPWYSNCASIKSILIEEGVTSIGNYAFVYCSSLTSVTIPESVTSIGSRAFLSCGDLTSITIPDSVTSIGENAFFFCHSLTSITIPDSVTSIGRTAFGSCSSLEGIWVDQNNMYYSSDDRGVLFNKDKTTLIAAPGEISGAYVIPQSVTSIGSWAFRDCSSLTGITIPDGVTSINMSVFEGCNSLTSVTIPEGVTSIGNYAFGYCRSLTSVTIPESVTSIDSYAFIGCSSLTSVTIPEGVTSIYYSTFSQCSSLTSITLPDTLTSIGDFAFNGCSSLTSVTIPEGVTSIGQSAFVGCSSLTSITIPDGVTRIDSDAFWECSSLDGIWVDQNNAYYSSDDRGVLFNKDKTALLIAPGGISGEYTVPESVTSIGGCAFCYCSGLTGVTFEGDAPSIGSYAFEGTTTTAYYPAGKTTWTEEAMQDYGGTITWVPYSDEAAVPTLTLKYPTLSFESEVLYNVYFTVADAEVAVEDLGLLTWYEKPASLADATVENAQYNIPGGIYNPESGEYMVRTQGVPAMRMGDDLYLRVYAKLSDGTYAYSAVTYYSAKDYADTILATSDNDAMKALCVAMLNYGAAAQQHFGHNTDNLMNGHLTEEQKNLVAQWSSDMMSSVIMPDAGKVGDFVSNGGFSGGYPSVSFDGAFAINYFFTANQTPDTDILLYFWDEETYLAESVLTATNAVRVVPMKETETSGRYMAAYAGIPAKDIGKTLFAAAVYECDGVRYSSPVVPYSLSAYCQDRIDNGSDTMKALARETAVYGWYAENYFSK